MFTTTPPPDLPPDPVTPVPLPAVRQRPMLGNTALAGLLAAMSMLGPFSVDAYLPAFPQIQATLHASAIEVQQTLSVYMLAFAGMVLWHGALADTFGRRNVILCSLVVFAIGTFGCAASHTVHYLWVFRIMQGVSAGAGVVVGRAVIRDLYAGAAAARLLSLVTMIFTIAPAIAPILGGWIVSYSDWRTIFLSLLAYTVVLFVVVYRRLPETLQPEKRQPFNPRFLAQSYASIFSSPLFHMKAGVVACNFAGLFLYITAAPVLLPEHLHLGPSQFGWLFIPSVSGILRRRAGGQPHRRQDQLRAPDRHRLLLPVGRGDGQRRLRLPVSAGAAVDRGAAVLLHLRHVLHRPRRDLAGAGPVPPYPRHRGLVPVVRPDLAGGRGGRGGGADAVAFGAGAGARPGRFRAVRAGLVVDGASLPAHAFTPSPRLASPALWFLVVFFRKVCSLRQLSCIYANITFSDTEQMPKKRAFRSNATQKIVAASPLSATSKPSNIGGSA